MGFFRFYLSCLRHIHKTTWFWIGFVSTLATFVGPCGESLNILDAKAMNTLLVCIFVLILVVCLLVVPWTQSFRIYQEKVAELQEEKKRNAQGYESLQLDREADRRRWDEERSGFVARLAERARSQEAASGLKSLYNEGQLLRGKIIESADDSPTEDWAREADDWLANTMNYISVNVSDAKANYVNAVSSIPMAFVQGMKSQETKMAKNSLVLQLVARLNRLAEVMRDCQAKGD